MTVRIEEPAAVKETFDLLETLALGHDPVVFRGHRVASWRLGSTLNRHTTVGPALRAMSINDMIDHFMVNLASIQARLPFSDDNRRARLEYSRHYGVPSPLIDFSHSHYVALFFAFNGLRTHHPGEKCAVYALNVPALAGIWAGIQTRGLDGKIDSVKFDEAYHRFEPDLPDYFATGYPPHDLTFIPWPASWNIRMLRQMGAFLYDSLDYRGGRWKDLEDLLAIESEVPTHGGHSEPSLTKIIMPASFATEVFQRLELAGITGTRLLDGHEGAAADVINAYNYNRKTGYAWDVRLPDPS